MLAHEPALNYRAERVAEPEPDLIDRSKGRAFGPRLARARKVWCSMSRGKRSFVNSFSFGMIRMKGKEEGNIFDRRE